MPIRVVCLEISGRILCGNSSIFLSKLASPYCLQPSVCVRVVAFRITDGAQNTSALSSAIRRSEDGLRAYRDWAKAAASLYSPDPSSPGKPRSKESFEAAREVVIRYAKVAGEKLRPLQLTPSWDIHSGTVYQWFRNRNYTRCFKAAHTVYLGQIPYKAFSVSSSYGIADRMISGITPIELAERLYFEDYRSDISLNCVGAAPTAKDPASPVAVLAEVNFAGVQFFLQALHVGSYRGMALLYPLAGSVLCLCALRSLFRGQLNLCSLWPRIPLLILGVVLMFFCRIDADIGVPQRYSYWFDKYIASETGRESDLEWSVLMHIAAKGWFSAIVLAFFAVSMLSVALISVRLGFGGVADARNT